MADKKAPPLKFHRVLVGKGRIMCPYDGIGYTAGNELVIDENSAAYHLGNGDVTIVEEDVPNPWASDAVTQPENTRETAKKAKVSA